MLRKLASPLALLCIIAMMVALCLLREIVFFPIMDMIPNPDTSWLIYAAGRVADGEKLYIDIMETNPPLIIWISMLPVLLARAFDMSALTAFPLFVTVLCMISLWLTASVMRGDKFLSQRQIFYPLLVFISFGFFLLTPAIYGQREMLLIVLVLPYLMRSLREKSDNNVPRDIAIILMAAIGFAIKPFFLLLWGMNELACTLKKRNYRTIVAWHNWVIGLFQLSYVAAILFATPEYLNTIVPTVLATYFSYESHWKNIGKFIGIVGALVFLIYALAKPHGDYKKPIIHVLFWMLAAIGFIILQRKEWINHLYPLVFMAGIAIVLMLTYLIEIWEDAGVEIGAGRVVALCASIVTIISTVWMDAKFWHFIYTNPSVIHGKLVQQINEHADGKLIYPLTFNLQSSFPVIAVSKGVFRGSFHHLWPMAGLIIREQEEIKNPEITNAYRFFYDTVVHDFSSQPPEFVWVDLNVNLAKIKDYDIEPENRDIIKVLSRDVRFAMLWQNYEKIGEVEGAPIDEKDVVPGEPNLSPERYGLYKRIKQVKINNEQ